MNKPLKKIFETVTVIRAGKTVVLAKTELKKDMKP